MSKFNEKTNRKGQIVYIVSIILGFIISCILLSIARNEHGQTKEMLNHFGLAAFLFTPGLWLVLATFNSLRGK